ncbi:MAG: hypothetical protein P1V21_11345 [Rhizobiaceae bacterium]|nr:hypothetical protein [Rhizobiaceae bacterium]
MNSHLQISNGVSSVKHTKLAYAAILLMTSLLGTPSFASGWPCETDPNWTCIELPDQGELPDPRVREKVKAENAGKAAPLMQSRQKNKEDGLKRLKPVE